MRLLVPILILVLFEYIVFQAVAVASSDLSEWLQFLIRSGYWMMPLALWLVLSQKLGRRQSPLETNKWNFLLSNSLMALYFGKLMVALLLGFDSFRRLLLSIYAHWKGAGGLEYPLTKGAALLILGLGIGFSLLLIYGMLRNRYRYKVHRKNVPVANLPKALEGLKIVQISDIHSGSFTDKAPLQKAIDIINREQADLVFFTGDLVNNVASEMEPFIPIFKNIKAKHGVFSILGNHDYGDYVLWKSTEAKLQNFKELIRTHCCLGWDLLMNEHRILDINGASLAVIGVENYSAKGRFSKYGDLSQAARGSETADVKLLLSHDPSHWLAEVVPDFEDIAITFSGHTHGMQFGIDFPGWFQWSPVQYVYQQWAGLYQKGKQYLYVNRGFGFLGYPGRLGILAEITVLELKGELI